MKINAAVEPDKFVTKFLAVIDEWGIDTLTKIINEIYNSGEIQEDISRHHSAAKETNCK